MFWPVFIKTDNQPQLVSIHVKPNLCRTVGRVVDSGSVRKLNHAIIALLRTICTFQHSADPNIHRYTRCLVQIQIQREIQKYSTCTFYPCSDPNIRGCTLLVPSVGRRALKSGGLTSKSSRDRAHKQAQAQAQAQALLGRLEKQTRRNQR